MARTKRSQNRPPPKVDKSPPKTKKSPPQQNPPPPKKVTLEEAIKCIDDLPNAEGSKNIWRNNIISLGVYFVPVEERGYDYFNLNYKELGEKYKDTDILPLIEDYDRTVDIIEGEIINKVNGEAIGFETKKQYFYAILVLIGKNGVIKLDTEKIKQYTDKKVEYDIASHNNRKTTTPKGAVAKHPELTWERFKLDFEQFLSETAFTNTDKGRRDLRQACIIGLYLLQTPRRVEDYATLQLYTTLPSKKEQEGKNILLLGKDKATIYIDKFKNRWKVYKGKEVPKEVMPRYVKELPPRLTSLFRDYIKKSSVTDMSKLKKGDKSQHYVFYKESGKTTDGYDPHAFSKVVSTSMKSVFKKTGLSVNTFRHVFEDFIVRNLPEYNELQLEQLAHEFGDKLVSTMLRYRHSNQANRDLDPFQEIGQAIEARNIAQLEALAGGLYEDQASEGSIGAGEDPEVVSPPIVQEVQPDLGNTPLNILYLKLGQATMEVERLKAEITARLNI
jgi:hypothetical protein